MCPALLRESLPSGSRLFIHASLATFGYIRTINVMILKWDGAAEYLDRVLRVSWQTSVDSGETYHVWPGEHVDVLDAHRLKDVLLEVVIKTQAGDTLKTESRVIDIDAVLPAFSRLIDKGLREEVERCTAEFIETKRTVVFQELWVEEAIAEASSMGE